MDTENERRMEEINKETNKEGENTHRNYRDIRC
jgi:hypothetical protein